MNNHLMNKKLNTDAEQILERTALGLIEKAGETAATVYGGPAGHIAAKGVSTGINYLYNKYR